MRNRWQRKRREEPEETPAEILGVVHPSGAGGAQSPPGEEWTLRFALKPWRYGGGGVDERELSISKRVSHERLREYMRLIQPYDVVRAQVRFSDELTATLLEVLGVDASDEELAQRATDLQRPVTVEVDFFGTLTLDPRLTWWETEQIWVGTPVRLSLSPDEDGNIETVAKRAEALWRSQPQWDQRIRSRAMNELLALKNENWRDEQEPEVTPAEFDERMKPESVTVYSDGGFEFWFEDGDLFFNHSILVSGNLTEGPTDADIAG
jgi:hypothetical protein